MATATRDGGETVSLTNPPPLPPPRKRVGPMRLDNELPFEVFQHCLTFLPTRDVCRAARVSKWAQNIAEDNWTWEMLLQRDYRKRAKAAMAEHADRRVKDVYEMVATGKYVERRFEDRPPWQRTLIVIGAIVLSPLLMIYLAPRIARGIHRNAVAPTLEAWASDPTPVPPRRRQAHTWADAQRLRVTAPPEADIPFHERPLWQRVVIILLSVLLSPYLVVRYRRRWMGWIAARARRAYRWCRVQLRYYIVNPVRRMLRRVRDCAWQLLVAVRRRVAALRDDVVKPYIVYPARDFVRDVAVPCAKRMAQRALRTALLAEDRVVSCGEWGAGCLLRAYRSRSGSMGKRIMAAWGLCRSTATSGWAALSLAAKRYVLRPCVTAAKWGREACVTYVVRPVQRAAAATRRAAVAFAQWIRNHMVVPCVAAAKRVAAAVRDRVLIPICRGARAARSAVVRSIRITGRFLYDRALAPVGRAAKRWALRAVAAGRALGRGVRASSQWLYTRLLAPCGRGVARCARSVVRAVRLTGAWLYAAVVAPVGRVLKTCGLLVAGSVYYTLRAMKLSAEFLYVRCIKPTGRAIRESWLLIFNAFRSYVVAPIRLAAVAVRQGAAQLGKAMAEGLRIVALALRDLVRAVVQGILEFFRAVGRKVGG